jgi:hypothetical protein
VKGIVTERGVIDAASGEIVPERGMINAASGMIVAACGLIETERGLIETERGIIVLERVRTILLSIGAEARYHAKSPSLALGDALDAHLRIEVRAFEGGASALKATTRAFPVPS